MDWLAKGKMLIVSLLHFPGSHRFNGYNCWGQLSISKHGKHLPAFLQNPWEVLEMHHLVKTQGVQTATYLLPMFLGLILSHDLGNLYWAACSKSPDHSLYHSVENHPDTSLAVLMISDRNYVFFLNSLLCFVTCCFPCSLMSITAAICKGKRCAVVWGNLSIFLVTDFRKHWIYCWYFEVSGSNSEVSLPAVAFVYWVLTQFWVSGSVGLWVRFVQMCLVCAV